MTKSIEHVHWPDAPDMWMPYAPAIKVKGGTTVYLAGVTAAPVYHHHPHRPAEFDSMPRDMEGQARAALENLHREFGHRPADWGVISFPKLQRA
jgi:2-iminobutanoate/2-iminopropanoate deaminase